MKTIVKVLKIGRERMCESLVYTNVDIKMVRLIKNLPTEIKNASFTEFVFFTKVLNKFSHQIF